jgi:hypothetical protein
MPKFDPAGMLNDGAAAAATILEAEQVRADWHRCRTLGPINRRLAVIGLGRRCA